MRHSILKITGTLLVLALVNTSCKKNEQTEDCPITILPATGPDYNSTGTLHRCLSDSNLWYMNATLISENCETCLPQPRLLVPVNLPAAYKEDGLSVNFNYVPLNDSLALMCWRCGTPPFPYGLKINITGIGKANTRK